MDGAVAMRVNVITHTTVFLAHWANALSPSEILPRGWANVLSVTGLLNLFRLLFTPRENVDHEHVVIMRIIYKTIQSAFRLSSCKVMAIHYLPCVQF
jgi:hypothetical protein